MKTGINPRKIATNWSAKLPESMRARLGPMGDWLDMMLVDHGFIRSLYINLHQVSPNLWRSAQPDPGAVKMLAARGIKTIINLRGERMCGSYILEKKACAEHGIRLVDFPLNSRGAPEPDRITRFAAMLETLEYPALIHCKSGADRAGIAAALILLLKEGRPAEEAQKQLSLKYGHVRQARTGVLDYFVEEYARANAEQPIDFLEWVQSSAYDPEEMTKHFRTNVMANVLVDVLLRRE